MPRIRASISLPYLLQVRIGSYPTGVEGRDLEVEEPPLLPGLRPTTMVSTTLDQPDTVDAIEQGRLNARQADHLLSGTNRLLRCYRAITRKAGITELSRAEASPFRFRVVTEAASPPAWEPELTYEADPPRALPL